MPRITVSYRREDSEAVTGRIFDYLVRRYGKESVFRDINDIPAGVDFRHHIDDVLHNTDLLLVVMGRKWLGPIKSGRTRIHDETDPVRVEVETALKRGISVIPVLIGDAKMPEASQLPDSLTEFAYRNSVRIDPGRDFEHHTNVLIDEINRALRVKQEGFFKKYWWTSAVAVPVILAAIFAALIGKESGTTVPPVPNTYYIDSITRIENQYIQFNNQPLSNKVRQDIQDAIELAAKREFQSAIDRYKRLPDEARVPIVLNNLGVAYEGLQDWPSARAAYAKAIEKSPGFAEATKNLERIKENNNSEHAGPAPKDPPAQPGIYFSDDFARKELGRDWKMMNPDPNKWTMQPEQKSLLFATQTGALSDTKNLKNWLVLEKDLPTTNFAVTVEASIQMQGTGNYIFAALFQDDENHILIGLTGWPSLLGRTPFFSQRSQGTDAANFLGEDRNGAAPGPERIFFKIDRTANRYSGAYAYADQAASADQLTWKMLGTVTWINFRGKLVLGAAKTKDTSPQIGAEFHSVLIHKK